MTIVTASSADLAAGTLGTEEASLWDYVALLKPRVMSLVIFTGVVGFLAAPGQTHPFMTLCWFLALSLGAGASGALNMAFDHDLDRMMERTQGRPIPQGRITPEGAKVLGTLLALFSVVLMGLSAHPLAAALLASSLFIYVGVYTLWLKRWTPQNIVIGGLAGALPPVIMWSCRAGDVGHPLPWILCAVIFFWTMPHFWALALLRKEDYQRAGIPMMPVVASCRSTCIQMLLYAVVTVGVSFLPYVLGYHQRTYGWISVLLGLWFLGSAVRLWWTEHLKDAATLFRDSIVYLFLLFLNFGSACL